MVKVEDIPNYGKEQFEQVVANATTFQSGVQAIATAYGDYAKKSFEDTKSFAEKLSGVKSLDKVLEAQSEYAKTAYETFVAKSQKIAGLYGDLAKQTFKPLEGLVSKFSNAVETINLGSDSRAGNRAVPGSCQPASMRLRRSGGGPIFQVPIRSTGRTGSGDLEKCVAGCFAVAHARACREWARTRSPVTPFGIRTPEPCCSQPSKLVRPCRQSRLLLLPE